MDKFLTVFAVFDDQTQRKLSALQAKVFELGNPGTQTMGIPFHLTLGSFPTDKECELVKRIKESAKTHAQFDIGLLKINHFGDKVVFVEPEVNESLMQLHNLFDCNYPYGHPYHAHATIFQGDSEATKQAKALLAEIFTPFSAKIVSIQMGEFFPTRMIISENLIEN
ncbi:MAG: 2'-5' RNA ligase family protein [Clostridia bacterium]|nr:2'-5' RNA ligase family protein [Clostridia bacterium]